MTQAAADVPAPAEKRPVVLASRLAAALGGLSFAAAVTAVTMIKRSGTTVSGTTPLLIFAVFGGMVAVALGLLGIAQARKLLIGGIFLGLIGVLSGAVTAFVSPLALWSIRHFEAMQMAEPAVKSTSQWIMFVGSGNITSAKAMSRDPIDEVKLTDAFEQMQGWGVIQSVDPRYGGDARDITNIEIQAKIVFDKGPKIVVTGWDATGPAPVLTRYEFHDDPLATPATQPK